MPAPTEKYEAGETCAYPGKISAWLDHNVCSLRDGLHLQAAERCLMGAISFEFMSMFQHCRDQARFQQDFPVFGKLYGGRIRRFVPCDPTGQSSRPGKQSSRQGKQSSRQGKQLFCQEKPPGPPLSTSFFHPPEIPRTNPFPRRGNSRN